MYKIKQLNEDFRVWEKIQLTLDDNGEYQYFELTKSGLTTQEAIYTLSEKLRIPRKYFGFAGNKDKHAITEQVISIRTNKSIRLPASIKLSLKHIGRGKERINLGSNYGNQFEIVVRNLSNGVSPGPNRVVPNYFDSQRFSIQNAEIGRHLLSRDFEIAAKIILENSRSEQAYEELSRHVTKNPRDHVGALLKLDKKQLLLYIHSVQSLLFNEILTCLIKNNCASCRTVSYNKGEFCFPNDVPYHLLKVEVPLLGFGTNIGEDEIGEILRQKLGQFRLKTRDFVIREIPFLSSAGGYRKAMVSMEGLTISESAIDELNSQMKKQVVSFALPKGSYATIAIKSIFG